MSRHATKAWAEEETKRLRDAWIDQACQCGQDCTICSEIEHMRRPTITKAHEGMPMEFRGFDGKQYNGRIIRIRKHFATIAYYVFGVGEVTTPLDLREHGDRVLKVW